MPGTRSAGKGISNVTSKRRKGHANLIIVPVVISVFEEYGIGGGTVVNSNKTHSRKFDYQPSKTLIWHDFKLLLL